MSHMNVSNDTTSMLDTPHSTPPRTPSTPISPGNEHDRDFVPVNQSQDADRGGFSLRCCCRFPVIYRFDILCTPVLVILCVAVSLAAGSPNSLQPAAGQQANLAEKSECELSPPPRGQPSVRRELPPRMEPRVPTALSVAPHYVSQRHPPPPPLNLHPLEEQQPSSEEAPPPPVPPRMRRESSVRSEPSPVSDSVPPPQVDGAAAALDSEAPPLPPRRQRNISSMQDLSLGISQTLPLHRKPFHPNATLPLPRRNSERDHLGFPHFVNVNGERGGSVTPELPPRTYSRHVVHSRQQSS